jgi:hypothetical protein
MCNSTLYHLYFPLSIYSSLCHMFATWVHTKIITLLSLFLDRLSHYPTHSAAKNPIHTQIARLNIVEHHFCTFLGEVVICIAASPSSNTTLAQPVAGVRVYHLGKLIASIKRPTGICLPWDAIIQALHLGICKTLTLLPNISFLQVMTTNLPAMHSALRVDVSSNQGHRIAIANVLAPWLSLGETWTVHFWAIPSGARWPLLQHVVNDVKNTNITTSTCPDTTIDSLHSRCISVVNTTWSGIFFNNPGSYFLHLRDLGDRLLWPTYVNRGAWLKQFPSLSLTTRVGWAIMAHAPIGEYRLSFFPTEPHSCRYCRAHLEMQEHILYECPHYMCRLQDKFTAIGYFQWFLDDNLDAFMFKDLPPPTGVG